MLKNFLLIKLFIEMFGKSKSKCCVVVIFIYFIFILFLFIMLNGFIKFSILNDFSINKNVKNIFLILVIIKYIL